MARAEVALQGVRGQEWKWWSAIGIITDNRFFILL